MSCATLLPPAGPQQPRIFKGDADILVDRLVAACAEAPNAGRQLPGFGRDLVPVASEWLELPAPLASRANGHEKRAAAGGAANPKAKKHNAGEKAAKAAAKKASSSKGGSPTLGPRDAPREPLAPPPAALCPGGDDAGFSLLSGLTALTSGAARAAPAPAAPVARPVAAAPAGRPAGYACPNFAVSPKPADLPMPGGLLSRAAARKTTSAGNSPPAAAPSPLLAALQRGTARA